MDSSYTDKTPGLAPFLFGVACLLLSAVPAATEPKALSPAETHQAAARSLIVGNDRQALALAVALLQRDASDVRALLVKTQAERNLGRYDAALASARSAWKLAGDDDQRFASALAIAQSLASDGKRTRAQLWLRRAVDIAPNEVTRQRAVRDFQYVRYRNPWAFEFNFNVTPTSNINNGSARSTTQLFGLPFEFQLEGAAQALKGTEFSTGVAGRYRFVQTANQTRDLVFQFSHRDYALSSEAKAMAPGTSGSDFALTQASAGYVWQVKPRNGSGRYKISATAGQSWYGGDSYYAFLRLGGSKDLKLGKTTLLTFSASGERQFGETGPNADVLRGDVTLRRRMGNFGQAGVHLGATESSSGTDIADYSEWRAGVDLALAKPVLGARIKFGLQMRQRDYLRSRYDPSGRDDREVSASIDMTFTEIERFGFNPTVSLLARRTESNIGLYDSEELGIRFGIRSAF